MTKDQRKDLTNMIGWCFAGTVASVGAVNLTQWLWCGTVVALLIAAKCQSDFIGK